MTLEVVKAAEPLRHSSLKKIGDCPAKYKTPVERKADFFDKGTGVHSTLLGGKRLAIWDKKSAEGNQCPRRGKDFDAFKELNADSLILTPDEAENVKGMVASIQANPDAMAALNGRKEKTLLWDIDGRPCRGTPDVDGGHFITELKTTKSSDPKRFYWDAKKYGYPAALAWYMDGIARQWPSRRVLPEEAYIVAVEAVKPWVTTVFRVPQRELDEGHGLNRFWLERLAECEKSGVFGGYATGIIDLAPPERDRGEWHATEDAA